MQLQRWAFVAAVVTTLACSAKVEAATIHVGVTTGGAPVSLASGVGTATYVDGSFAGAFDVVASGKAEPVLILPSLFNTSTLNASTVGAGTLDIYITAIGLTATGVNNFITTLTSNTLSNATATLSAYLDTDNGIFTTICGTCVTLASAAFGAPGTTTVPFLTDAGPDAFSITALYHIVFSGQGDANLTINVAVPGPVLGAGIPGLILACGALIALARRRRKFA